MAIDDHSRTCVVIGGRGFVGRPLVLRLLKLGNWIVRIADSAHSLQLDPSERGSLLAEALSTGRASYFHVDVRNKPQIIRAIEGSSVVFYTEATCANSHDFYLCYTIIVEGVKNVTNACRECKVKRLIYNSTTDVVFDGSHDILNADESVTYPCKFDDMLSDLKAQAEALVRLANDIDGLLTCTLRPSNVFGPADTEFVPHLVNEAKCGWAKFIIGSSQSLTDFTYVENVAHALICAEQALDSQSVSVSGKVFFITNAEPIRSWEFVSRILEGLGCRRPMIQLPPRMACYITSLIKWMQIKTGSCLVDNYPSLHRIINLAACTRTFNCSASQKHIGYSPVVSLKDGIKLTVESFSHLAEDSSLLRCRGSGEQSKVEKLLGGGKVSDILLWRDEKRSFLYFLAVALLYYWFFLCGRTFVSSVATLLLLITVALYGYSFLPSNLLGFRIQKISLSYFDISEMDMKTLFTTFARLWNSAVQIVRSLAQGEDWNYFIKVTLLLYCLKLIVSKILTIAVGLALVLAFTSFFVYEQYEHEVDGTAKALLSGMRIIMKMLIGNLPVPVASYLRNYYIFDEDRGI